MINGYELIDNFLTKEEHEYYLNICKETYEGTHGKQHSHFSWNGEDNLNKINGACNYQPKFLELASNPILVKKAKEILNTCLLYTSPSPRDVEESRMPSSA